VPAWNPSQYLKFSEERTRPAEDLCQRIPAEAPARVLDLGCGPGNSTEVLWNRWPDADILGLDSSPDMIAKARANYSQRAWILGDLVTYRPEEPFDVVFSNAVLQWLPEHEKLLPALLSLVAPGGHLAVQVPVNQESPLHRALGEVQRRPRWSRVMAAVQRRILYRDPRFYYETLTPRCARVDLWETIYHHVMPNHQSLIDWFEGTGLRPSLEQLPDPEDRRAFKAEVLETALNGYPLSGDGKVLFPFRRLFFVASL